MRMDLAIRGGSVLTPTGFQEGMAVGIGGGRVVALGDVEEAETEVDASGLHVLPGFVDVHIHGAGGSSDPRTMARFLPNTGVTAFLPTLAASSTEDTLAFASSLALVRSEAGAAEVLGGHLEGPFLSRQHCGAQPAEHLRAPDVAQVERLLAAAGGTLRRMTIAPELAGAHKVISRLVEGGVQVSLGHSACSYEQAVEAVGWGASAVTHTYNAMAPFHHRAPGLAGAAATSERLVAELIADGVHVHPAAAVALVRACGAARVAVVSDGLPALGLAAGEYDWAGRAVHSDGLVAQLADGRLAGSATTLLQALRNLVSWGVPLADTARMLAQTGARLAGVGNRKGAIAPGFDADIVLLDRELRLVATYCRGAAAELTTERR